MSRTIPSSILTALSQPTIEPFYAVELLFDSAPIRLWTGHGVRTIEGNTYTGTGSLLSISGLEEIGDLSAKNATVTLSGVSDAFLPLALQEPYQRRTARILFGVLGSVDVVEMFSGKMNQMPVSDSAETSSISVTIESKMVELEKTKPFRYTHESQQSLFSGDTFFSYVTDLQDRQLLWGRV